MSSRDSEIRYNYSVVVRNVADARQQKLSWISYNPLIDLGGQKIFYNDWDFNKHHEWLAKAHPDLVFWLLKTDWGSYEGGQGYILCWRDKFGYEKLIDSWWSWLFGPPT